MTLKETTYNAAQSATVWAINALVQGQKAMLGQLLQPETVSTLLRCVTEDNGAAPGTVRLLLVVFLHSGKHEELRTLLLGSPDVLMALLDILRKGPSVEPTKWTASLLSTLCWQENSMKDVMVELRAPMVRRRVCRPCVSALSWQLRLPGQRGGRPLSRSTAVSDEALAIPLPARGALATGVRDCCLQVSLQCSFWAAIVDRIALSRARTEQSDDSEGSAIVTRACTLAPLSVL